MAKVDPKEGWGSAPVSPRPTISTTSQSNQESADFESISSTGYFEIAAHDSAIASASVSWTRSKAALGRKWRDNFRRDAPYGYGNGKRAHIFRECREADGTPVAARHLKRGKGKHTSRNIRRPPLLPSGRSPHRGSSREWRTDLDQCRGAPLLLYAQARYRGPLSSDPLHDFTGACPTISAT
jgi:hypothetical protein